MDPWFLVGLAVAGTATVIAVRRVAWMVATLRARAFAPALLRHLARWVKARPCSDEEFFRADRPPEPWVGRRRAGLERLAALFRERHPRSTAWGDAIRDSFSDLRFTDANRVPFPFARYMRAQFNLAAVVTATDGPWGRDLDGQWSLDVSGAYGVNVAGNARYKEWMARGVEQAREVGLVLGPLMPLTADNIALLKTISGLDEVSFHMSGTEAVMAAVRLARFNTGRRLIVTFAGAYHGWWDGVQPGLGNERDLGDCLTLKDLHPAALAVIRRRAREIAAVVVNPIQAFHPNTPPPNDAVLLTSQARTVATSSARYAVWLRDLRDICDAHDVPLIFDEVYTGFRLAVGGAQEHFGVRADMVIYGKTVAGGFPVGVVCGTRRLMRRFDPDHPMRVAYVIGTFSAHPVVMGAMNEFLRWAVEPSTRVLYEEMNARCAGWARETNEALAAESLPLQVVHFGTVWTVRFPEPGRYHWLLQYYLRAEGVTLSWVGTGRCLATMDFTEKDYRILRDTLLAAARCMRADGWWLTTDEHPGRDRAIRGGLMRDMIRSVVPESLQRFSAEVMRRKSHDHHASHSNAVNQIFHIISSSVFVVCSVAAFWDLTSAMWAGLAALFLRQTGHAILEPPCHDKELTLLGYTTRNKTLILGTYILIPAVDVVRAMALAPAAAGTWIDDVAWHWFLWTLVVVLGRVAYLAWSHGPYLALVWIVKLATDPITDIIAYTPRFLRPA